MKRLESTPLADGYRMPGEFEPHAGTWILWPERPDNWRLGAKPAQQAFVDVAAAIAAFEPVTVGVSAAQYDNAAAALPANVRVVELSNNDSWVRDCGPTFVKNAAGDVRGIDWEFNAWGGLVDGLYFPWDKDDQVARKICEIERACSYRTTGFVLEGGSIHVDGEGTLYTTEECLLSEGRNPGLTREEIEETLRQYLAIEKVIWLKNGIYLDETNGHVDNICCVVRPGVVLLAWTDDTDDPQYEISAQNLEILQNTTDAKGRAIEVIKLPLPKPILITAQEAGGVDAVEGTLPRCEGDRLAASYVNFYIANGAIIAPCFDDPNDAVAAQVLAEAFPDRKVVQVYAREILLGGGNIHCITQQQPE
ncbi:MAG: agmatine deiminase [Coriobacteriales bacterium]|nr:agmatine deiminase [Coriobacteriales bacterium]